jgi:hypothetical protein
MPHIECKACGYEADTTPTERYACPACGSSEGLHIAITLTDDAGAHDSLRTKGHDEDGHEFLDANTGDSFYRKDAEWHDVTQVVDRRAGRYRKKIIRKSTGEVLRDEDVPLDQHEPTAVTRRRAEGADRKRGV